MGYEEENFFKHYSIIFLGPNGEVGSQNSGIGNSEQEAIEAGGMVERIWGKSRHPAEDKFIKGPATFFSVNQYSIIKALFPAGPLPINDNGEMYLGDETWKP